MRGLINTEVILSQANKCFLKDTLTRVLNPKEVHSFDHEKRASAEKYLKCFNPPPAGKVNVDATPQSIAVFKRMLQVLPDEVKESAKFIIGIREPVSRAYSQYKHGVCECSNPFSHEFTARYCNLLVIQTSNRVIMQFASNQYLDKFAGPDEQCALFCYILSADMVVSSFVAL